MKTTELFEKWAPLVEVEGLPEIANKSRKEIVAAILENQERDIEMDQEGLYSDKFIKSQLEHLGGGLTEAVVAGDHGYNASDIASGKNSGAAVGIGPTVMGMVRRAIPNMIAFDICGVQPMSLPTGQIFSFHAMYGKNSVDASALEAFNPVTGPDVAWSGAYGKDGVTSAFEAFTAIVAGTATTANATNFWTFKDGKKCYYYSVAAVTITTGSGASKQDTEDAQVLAAVNAGKLVEISNGMVTSLAELMEGFNDNTHAPAWNEMSFRIDKKTIEAKSRQLKAQYSIELAQDLRAVHGLSADSELSTILATEIQLEINREVLLWVNATSQIGKTGWTNMHGGQAGVFNFADPNDVRGARWAGESYKALIIQIDKEASEIARQTGRGPGNFLITSRNVAAAFGHTDQFIGPAVQGSNTSMNTDTNKSTFAGVLAGKYSVYIDQYAKEDYITVGYKGSSELDAGIFYCPYVAMTPLRGSDPKNFQPVLGWKTRYAIGIHPMADSVKNTGFTQISTGMPTPEMFGKSAFFRRFRIHGI